MGAYKKAWMKAYRERNLEEVRARERAQYWANRERRLKTNKDWQEAHPSYQLAYYYQNHEKRLAQARESYLRNREKRLAANREYHRANREAVNARYRKRYQDSTNGLRLYNLKRHYERHALGKVDAEWLQTLARDPCSYCGQPSDGVDHIQPIAKGGTNDSGNLTAACRRCNSRKKDRSLLVFLIERLSYV